MLPFPSVDVSVLVFRLRRLGEAIRGDGPGLALENQNVGFVFCPSAFKIRNDLLGSLSPIGPESVKKGRPNRLGALDLFGELLGSCAVLVSQHLRVVRLNAASGEGPLD